MEVIVTNGTIPEEECKYYADYVQEKYPYLKIQRLLLTLDGDSVDIYIEPARALLAKMSGALIGDPMKWNDAKSIFSRRCGSSPSIKSESGAVRSIG